MSRKGLYSSFVKNPFRVCCMGRKMILRPAIFAKSGVHSMDIMAKSAFSFSSLAVVRSDRTLFALSVIIFKAVLLARFLSSSDKWVMD